MTTEHFFNLTEHSEMDTNVGKLLSQGSPRRELVIRLTCSQPTFV